MKSEEKLTPINEDKTEILQEGEELPTKLQEIDGNTNLLKEKAVALKKVSSNFLDGREYNLEQITTEIRTYTENIALLYVETGKRLLAVKKVEGHGFFSDWLHNNFGFSERTAQYWMFVAAKLEHRPELAPLAKVGISKAKALLDLPEEYLDEFAEHETIDGRPIDEYHTKSRDELIKEVKQLRNKAKKVEVEEIKGLKSENKALIEENKRLRKYDPAEVKDVPTWARETVKEMDTAAAKIVSLSNGMMDNEKVNSDIVLQAKVQEIIETGRKALDQCIMKWGNTFSVSE